MNIKDKDKVFRIGSGVVFAIFLLIMMVSYNSAKKESTGKGFLPEIKMKKPVAKEKTKKYNLEKIVLREAEVLNDLDFFDDGVASKRMPGRLVKEESTSSPKTPDKTAKMLFDVYRIQIGSFKKETEARDFWDLMGKKYPGVFGNLSLNLEKIVNSKGPSYKVQTNKMRSSQAKAICNAIDDCFIVRAK